MTSGPRMVNSLPCCFYKYLKYPNRCFYKYPEIPRNSIKRGGQAFRGAPSPGRLGGGGIGSASLIGQFLHYRAWNPTRACSQRLVHEDTLTPCCARSHTFWRGTCHARMRRNEETGFFSFPWAAQLITVWHIITAKITTIFLPLRRVVFSQGTWRRRSARCCRMGRRQCNIVGR